MDEYRVATTETRTTIYRTCFTVARGRNLRVDLNFLQLQLGWKI